MPTTLGHGWLIAEDEAMKLYMQGMAVTDSTSPVGGRPVPVWFRLPEAEERQRAYPYLTIDMIDIVEANGRAMVNPLNVSKMTYAPPEPVAATVVGSSLIADRPVPVDLHYQITAVSRSARHDRQLQSKLWHKFPGKWGALYVPNDETARTMQLLGRASAHDVDEYGKRSFRTNYTVSVASELWASVIKQIVNLTEIHIGVGVINGTSLTGIHLNCNAER